MPASLHFGVTLPQIKRTWEETRAAATEFDALGFDSVWVCDHVYGVPNPGLPILEAWSLLAAIAALTERVELGTLVSPPFFRNPGVFAKQIATVDQISGGRALPGLGAGWFAPEFEAYGNPFPSLGERMQALDELAQVLDGLWSHERFDFEGRFFRMKDAICEPKPVRRPPILIGGGGEKVLMGIAARRADIWNNMAITQAQLGHKAQVMKQRCREVGRDPESLRISQQCVVIIEASEDRARQSLEKAQKIYAGHMGAGLESHGIWGTPERVIECIEQHRAHGCTDFVIEFFGRDTRPPARLFAQEVLPALRS